MMGMVTEQIKKVPKPPMIKMWNWGNLIGGNMTIQYPDNPGGFQINEFPIHQFVERDVQNSIYAESEPSSVTKLSGHEQNFHLI